MLLPALLEVRVTALAFGARNIVISTNVELRRDGLPYAGRRPPEDQGVASYFTYNGSEQCIPCDKWRRIRENMRAIE